MGDILEVLAHAIIAALPVVAIVLTIKHFESQKEILKEWVDSLGLVFLIVVCLLVLFAFCLFVPGAAVLIPILLWTGVLASVISSVLLVCITHRSNKYFFTINAMVLGYYACVVFLIFIGPLLIVPDDVSSALLLLGISFCYIFAAHVLDYKRKSSKLFLPTLFVLIALQVLCMFRPFSHFFIQKKLQSRHSM